MGHQRIGVLPKTRNWEGVFDLIAGGGEVASVAASTAKTIEAALLNCANDPGVCGSFYLLARIPLAARDPDYPASLKRLGLELNGPPLLSELASEMMRSLDEHTRKLIRTDFGELAALSAVESLHAVAGQVLHDLFEDRAVWRERTREVLGELATVKQFGLLARDFFGRLLRRQLDYFLSRELPQHVGISERFASLREHLDFDDALDRHCHETAEMVRKFAGEWHSKTTFEGGITEEKVGGFIKYAFKKLVNELQLRATQHA
jgi:hypothetical protein